MGRFSQDQATRLLARCHRRCCICHRFCGVKMELDHITPVCEGGSDDIENAIPLCFECHAEIHSYNDRHPRGRKFRPEELRLHKEQWLKVLDERPALLVQLSAHEDVGPLQALIDELEFNLAVAAERGTGEIGYPVLGCLFLDDQFRRALASGSVAVLRPPLKESLLATYRVIMKANNLIPQAAAGNRDAEAQVVAVLADAESKIRGTHMDLLSFIGSEEQAERATQE